MTPYLEQINTLGSELVAEALVMAALLRGLVYKAT